MRKCVSPSFMFINFMFVGFILFSLCFGCLPVFAMQNQKLKEMEIEIKETEIEIDNSQELKDGTDLVKELRLEKSGKQVDSEILDEVIVPVVSDRNINKIFVANSKLESKLEGFLVRFGKCFCELCCWPFYMCCLKNSRLGGFN